MDGTRTSSRPPADLRRTLRSSTIDGMAFMVMVGFAETYFPALTLELGHGEALAGLILTIPLAICAFAQLASRRLAARLGSARRLVIVCAGFQVLSLLPLAAVAAYGAAPAWLLFALVTCYFAGAIVGGPAWSSWMGAIIPERVRARYFATRNRWLWIGALAGLVFGDVFLRLSNLAEDRLHQWYCPRPEFAPAWHWLIGRVDFTLPAYAGLFLAAAAARAVSTYYLWRQPEPAGHDRHTDRRVSAGEMLRRARTTVSGRLIIYLLVCQLTLPAAQPFWHPYVREQLAFNYAEYVLLLASMMFGRMLSLPLWGRIAHRRGSVALLRLGGLGLVPIPLAWLVVDGVWAMVAVQFFAGAVVAAWELAAFLMLIERIAPDERTSAISKFNFASHYAGASGSTAGGLLLGSAPGMFEYALLFAGSVVARLATLPLLLRVQRAEQTPEPLSRGPVEPLEAPGLRQAGAGGAVPGDIAEGDMPSR